MKAQSVARLGIVLGVVLAAVAMILVHQTLLKASQPSPSTPMVSEVVLTQPVAPDTTLTAQDVTTKSVATADVPPGALTSTSQAVGEVTQEGMVTGEPVLSGLLYSSPQAAGITAQLPAGMRAVELPVSAQSGVGSALQPGDHVDILALLSTKGKPQVSVLMTNILVLGLVSGSSTVTVAGQDTSGYSGVLLKLTDRQAAALLLTTDVGSVELVLRGAGDRSGVPPVTVTVNSLKGEIGP